MAPSRDASDSFSVVAPLHDTNQFLLSHAHCAASSVIFHCPATHATPHPLLVVPIAGNAKPLLVFAFSCCLWFFWHCPVAATALLLQLFAGFCCDNPLLFGHAFALPFFVAANCRCLTARLCCHHSHDGHHHLALCHPNFIARRQVHFQLHCAIGCSASLSRH